MVNSISIMRPELVPEWSPRNLPITPDNVSYGSNKLYWWKGSCGHEWQTSAKARSCGEKCPICSNARIIAGLNDLNTLEPDLAKEWSDKAILFCIVSHVLDSPDLLLERAPLLNLIILRLDEAALAVILQIQIILQRLISCIGGYFFISTENG